MHTAVTEGFFRTMGMPVLRGRDVQRADYEDPRPVAWVNESFARTFFDGDALGEQIYLGDVDTDSTDAQDVPWMEIVGVVGDVHHFGLQEDVRPLAYFPIHGPADVRIHLASLMFVLRTDGDPAALTPAVRAAVRDVDPEVPVTSVKTMDAVLSESLASTSFTMVLLAITATVALVLGAVGIYGVIAWVVSQRTREIGVRMALGAQAEDVRRMVLGQGMAVTAVGIAVGLLAAFGLTRLMASLLFGITATDPLTFVAVTVTLAAVATLATWLPAERATRVDPCESLRAE
jgi:putative ABC transport system permease protein